MAAVANTIAQHNLRQDEYCLVTCFNYTALLEIPAQDLVSFRKEEGWIVLGIGAQALDLCPDCQHLGSLFVIAERLIQQPEHSPLLIEVLEELKQLDAITQATRRHSAATETANPTIH